MSSVGFFWTRMGFVGSRCAASHSLAIACRVDGVASAWSCGHVYADAALPGGHVAFVRAAKAGYECWAHWLSCSTKREFDQLWIDASGFLAMSIRNTPVPEWWRPLTWSQHDVASARATTVGESRGGGAWRGGGGLRGAGFGA